MEQVERKADPEFSSDERELIDQVTNRILDVKLSSARLNELYQKARRIGMKSPKFGYVHSEILAELKNQFQAQARFEGTEVTPVGLVTGLRFNGTLLVANANVKKDIVEWSDFSR